MPPSEHGQESNTYRYNSCTSRGPKSIPWNDANNLYRRGGELPSLVRLKASTAEKTDKVTVDKPQQLGDGVTWTYSGAPLDYAYSSIKWTSTH
ncbi:hypothetical protein D3C79_573930 [compost metagenome]